MKKLIFLLLISVTMTAQTVYKTPSGAKYHKSDCRTVKNTSEAISLGKAADFGLTACKICKPAAVQPISKSSKKPSGESPETVQCKGITKKGSRCKHRTRIANGYCFQHQKN